MVLLFIFKIIDVDSTLKKDNWLNGLLDVVQSLNDLIPTLKGLGSLTSSSILNI